jgi:hypothetical protein
MEGVYIRWTVENWITVLLMAAIGYVVFAVASQIFLKGKAPGATLRVVA